eukprot:8692100-Lingulodinium_polyedra.AAC.1
MMRPSRPYVATVVRDVRIRTPRARAKHWRARGVREREIREFLRWRTVNSPTSLCSVSEALRNDAVAST